MAADMFVGRERFATLLLMRLTETVILWLSGDQSFWDDIEEGPRPLGPLGLQQVSIMVLLTPDNSLRSAITLYKDLMKLHRLQLTASVFNL